MRIFSDSQKSWNPLVKSKVLTAVAKSLQSCPTLWPHRQQPTRLPRPWNSPGKNTGVGCHFLLQCMKVKSESEVAQSCPTLSDPMDCSLPGFSVHGIFQARVLEWGDIAFSKVLTLSYKAPHDLPPCLPLSVLLTDIIFYHCPTTHSAPASLAACYKYMPGTEAAAEPLHWLFFCLELQAFRMLYRHTHTHTHTHTVPLAQLYWNVMISKLYSHLKGSKCCRSTPTFTTRTWVLWGQELLPIFLFFLLISL